MDNVLNKFTFHAKKVLVEAQDLAFVLKKDKVEPIFILYILTKEKGSLAAEVLNKIKLTPEVIKKYITDQEIPIVLKNETIKRENLPWRKSNN
jgi:ATP-dependent Clp protease ATP-binding subunit ClpA